MSQVQSATVDEFNCIQNADGNLRLSLGSKVLIQRSSGESDKGSDMVKVLVRASPSYSATALSSLLGISKDDTCEGLPLVGWLPWSLFVCVQLV